METVHTIRELRRRVAHWRRAGERVAFVPTMGNLHAGHIRLVEEARTRAPRTVSSIFVNPMQFGPNEDLERYPRTLAADSDKLAAVGLDLLFAPPVEEIYPRGTQASTRVEVPGLSDILCGQYRPGHFVGVATVVTKLFNLVQPDLALFGEKDFQQLLVIKRLVGDLDMPVEVVGVPTVRESDGLAMSSRNQYLDPEQRALAPILYRLISDTARRLEAGEVDHAALQQAALETLEKAGLGPEYFEIRRTEDLQPAGSADRDLVILAAARLGATRLIDNRRVALQNLQNGP